MSSRFSSDAWDVLRSLNLKNSTMYTPIRKNASFHSTEHYEVSDVADTNDLVSRKCRGFVSSRYRFYGHCWSNYWLRYCFTRRSERHSRSSSTQTKASSSATHTRIKQPTANFCDVINEQHSPSPRPSVDKTQTTVEPVVLDKTWTRRSLVLDHNDFMSHGSNSRLQSPARTIDGIDFNDDNNQPFASIYVSIRKLIDFEWPYANPAEHSENYSNQEMFSYSFFP